MKKYLMSVAIIAAMVGVATPSWSADKLKACWVYVGPVGDGGYSYQHDVGRKDVERALGDKVETTFLENVTEADSERAIERLARSGCKIIFTTSFGFMDATLKVAAKYPDIKFEHATGYKTAPNVATYNAKFHEGRYVLGQIAAKMSKTGTAGYIVSFPIPEVVSGINSFMLGAQSINPNFKVKIIWVNSWFDPGKEADAAKVLLSQGADIMVQHTDSTAPLQIAQEQSKLGFGQSSDMSRSAPKAQMTAIVDNWGPYYIKRVQDMLDGKWQSQQSWEGMKEGLVVMAPYSNMPDEVAKLAAATQAAITAGTLNPFTGPITKQDGTVVGEAGKPLPDADILGMNWYVKGVDDKLPQ